MEILVTEDKNTKLNLADVSPDSPITDLKIYSNPNKRKCITVRFKENVTNEDLVRFIVNLHAEEYAGITDNYHVFFLE